MVTFYNSNGLPNKLYSITRYESDIFTFQPNWLILRREVPFPIFYIPIFASTVLIIFITFIISLTLPASQIN